MDKETEETLNGMFALVKSNSNFLQQIAEGENKYKTSLEELLNEILKQNSLVIESLKSISERLNLD